MSATTAETAETISHLRVGERFWCWHCDGVEGDQPQLMAAPLAADPGMDGLRARVSQLSLRLGAVPLTGLGSVGDDGHVRITSPLASPERLAALAAWVKAHVADHPGLARLKDARLLNVSASGTVQAIHQDAALWDGVPDAPSPGSVVQAAAQLARLKPGRRCWFWMSTSGAGDQPALLLRPTKSDPDGTTFIDAVLQERRKATDRRDELRGQLHRSEGGALLLTTNDSIAAGPALARALMAGCAPLAELLEGALLAQTSGDEFAHVVRLSATPRAASSGPDLSAQARILSGLTEPGATALFWLCRSEDGAHLVLAEGREELKAAARATGAHGDSVRGQVVVSSKGWLELRTHSPFTDFIATVAGWATRHRAAWPDLARLRGARWTQRDREDNIVAREKNDDVWANL